MRPNNFVLLLLAVASLQVQEAFWKSMGPLLKTYCFKCHGEKKPKAGIRAVFLLSAKAARQGAPSQRA
jgi:hypothetical protein